MKNKWEISHDADDDDDGTPTCWALEVNHKKYGKYVWISMYDNDDYRVEVIPNRDSETIALVTCKSLTSAKRWVSMKMF